MFVKVLFCDGSRGRAYRQWVSRGYLEALSVTIRTAAGAVSAFHDPR
jgi:hypothetical protein